MNNAGLPRKPANVPEPPTDDIPEALRDTPDVQRRSRKPIVIGGTIFGLAAIALGIGVFASSPKPKPTNTPSPTSSQAQPSPDATDGIDIQGRRHLAYDEAPTSELQPITPDGRIRLRAAAAKAFQSMSAAAAKDGVTLVPISGFRSASEQQHLFFDVKAQRGQDAMERADVSAPPGYSEHHTGYAVDIGDGRTPATNLSPSFENTPAFKWLDKHAPYYNFELSFPKGNAQGINYEPWHWRFVGDRASLETFYKAKQLTTPASTPTTELSPTPTPEAESSPTNN